MKDGSVTYKRYLKKIILKRSVVHNQWILIKQVNKKRSTTGANTHQLRKPVLSPKITFVQVAFILFLQ